MKTAQKIPTLKLFVGAVTLMVTAVVVVGLYVAGSPAKERNRQLDEQRVNELQQIANAIDAAYDREARLPETLDELKAGAKEYYYVQSIVDPKTNEPYEYLVTGATTYDLCAVFDDVTQQRDQYGRLAPAPAARPMETGAVYPGYRDWTHGAGRHCYSIDVDDRPANQACGLRNPCQAGQTCAQLPDKKGTFCVPSGKECLAAGCAEDKCVIMESYPVQVRCTDRPEPPPAPSADSCTLMRERGTGRMDCFGCGRTVCKDPALGWEPYERPADAMGIPYACYIDDNGACALAQ